MLSLVLAGVALLGWPDLRARARLRLPAPGVATVDRSVLLRGAVVPAGALLGFGLAGLGGLVAASALTGLGLWWWRDRARFRGELDREAGLASGLRLLVAELRAGSHPAAAAEGAAADTGEPVASIFRDLAAAARLGGDVRTALAAAHRPGVPPPRGDPLARIGRAWALAERHGVALAELLDAVRRDLDHRVGFAREVESKLAGPRATAAVLAGLPLVGLLLGEASGARPLAVLSGTWFGQVLLVLGTGLLCAGALWTVRLTAAVVRR